MNWYLQALKKYADFSGRARRKEYWFFFLFNLIASIVLSGVDMAIGTGGVLSGIYGLAVLIPSIACGVRRMHDIDRTGWWLLIAFVPLIGAIVLIVFALLPGTAGDNKYGPDPKAAG
jgi:uncharacterized membrane protein YhaH (DUF805 family)